MRIVGDGELAGKVARTIQRRMTSSAAGKKCEGMASTLAALQLDGGIARIVSVGDSRVYLHRAGQLMQITTDHTIANQMVRDGEITAEQALSAGSLCTDLASALVASEFEEDFEMFSAIEQVHAGDRWICLTDGATGVLSDAELAGLLEDASASPDLLASRIVMAAKQRREGDDNISAVVIAVQASNSWSEP